MTALVVTLFAHAGGRLAVLAAQTVDQTGRPGAVILGIVIAQDGLTIGANGYELASVFFLQGFSVQFV